MLALHSGLDWSAARPGNRPLDTSSPLARLSRYAIWNAPGVKTAQPAPDFLQRFLAVRRSVVTALDALQAPSRSRTLARLPPFVPPSQMPLPDRSTNSHTS